MHSLPTPPTEPEQRWKPAIATVSLGTALHHPIATKIAAAAAHGAEGLELFHDDLAALAASIRANAPAPARTDREYEIDAAHAIAHLAGERGLSILALQPFRHYEGLRDRAAHAARIDELRHWAALCRVLGDSLFILIPSTFLPETECEGDRDLIAADLAEAADAVFPVRVAYEALAWGTHVNTWEDSWALVQAANRPNLGLCLDTFNIAARVWADPTSLSGKVPGADAALAASMERLVREVDPARVLMVQLADGERVDPNAEFLTAPGLSTLLAWSRNARLFPCEEERGGYLPIREVADACLNGLGYSGWVSMEVFSRTLLSESSSVPMEHAARASRSWQRVLGMFSMKSEKI